MGRQCTFLLWAGVVAVVAAAAAAQCPVTCTLPEVYRWRTGCEVPEYSMEGYTRIHTIQGKKHTSDYEGLEVTTIGSVTGRVSNGFFLQDVYEDCDDATSEGIFIFTGSPVDYARYQVVEVTGVVEEISYGGSLPMTQIHSSAHKIVFAGRVEPNPHQFIPLGKLSKFGSYEEDRTKARTDLRDLECSAVPTDAICQYEQREGMLMKIRNPIAAGTSKADETAVIRDGPVSGDNTAYFGGAVLKGWTVQDYVGEAVIIRDEIKQSRNFPIGTTFRRIKGILTLDTDGNMAMWPTYKLEEVKAAPATPPPECPAQNPGSTLRVATFDLSDYCKGRSQLAGIADQIADGLDCPDVIALQSVGDDSCNTNNGVVGADAGLSDLTAAINQAGRCGGSSKEYVALQVNPQNLQEGGRDGFNSRVVVLYNIRKLIFNARLPAGVDPKTTGTTVVNGELTINPGRVDPSSAAFDGERKTLAVEFEHTSGKKVFVVVNHWNSRDADDGVFAAMQPPVQHSQVKREQMQAAVSEFLKTLPDSAAAVFVLGNLQEFYWSNVLKDLRFKSGAFLENLWKKMPNKERYSYYELGRFMPLDHILVRKTDYSKCNLCALRANTMAGPDQVSDHDPLVAECNGFSGDANPAR